MKAEKATIWHDDSKKLTITLDEPIWPEDNITVVAKPELPFSMTSTRWNEWIRSEEGKNWAKVELKKHTSLENSRHKYFTPPDSFFVDFGDL